MLTLNQIEKRIQTIVEAHKQVRSFYSNQLSDEFFNEHTVLYPTVLLEGSAGKISPGGHATTLNYRIFFMDLVHVSYETDINEQEVLSDMLSVAEDIVTQLNNPRYNDWILSTDNPFQFQVKQGGDMYAGLYVDFSIRKVFTQNSCAIPSDLVVTIPTENDTKVYDTEYITDGTEGNVLNVPIIVGKKVLYVTRENSVLFKVSNNPNTTEFVWNDTVITLNADVPTLPGERFLILYRNY